MWLQLLPAFVIAWWKGFYQGGSCLAATYLLSHVETVEKIHLQPLQLVLYVHDADKQTTEKKEKREKITKKTTQQNQQPANMAFD